MTTVEVKIELGHRAECREKPTPNGFTHDWVMFVRGVQDKPIHHFVEKIVFYLHESFIKPKRVVREPPFQLKESGYAGFILPIEIYFKNRDGPKKVKLDYDLFLHLPGCPPVNHVRCEKLTFHNPTADLQRKLVKAGGVIVPKDKANNVPKSSITSFSSGHQGSESSVFASASASSSSNNNATSSFNKSIHQHAPHHKSSGAAGPHSTSSTHKNVTTAVPAALTCTTKSQTPIASSSSADNLSFTSLFGDPITKPNQQKDSRNNVSLSHQHYHKKKPRGDMTVTPSTLITSSNISVSGGVGNNGATFKKSNSTAVTVSSSTAQIASKTSLLESPKPSKLLKISQSNYGQLTPQLQPHHVSEDSKKNGGGTKRVALNSPLFDSEDSFDAFDDDKSFPKKTVTSKHKKGKLAHHDSDKIEPQPYHTNLPAPKKSVSSSTTATSSSKINDAALTIISSNSNDINDDFGSGISSPTSPIDEPTSSHDETTDKNIKREFIIKNITVGSSSSLLKEAKSDSFIAGNDNLIKKTNGHTVDNGSVGKAAKDNSTVDRADANVDHVNRDKADDKEEEADDNENEADGNEEGEEEELEGEGEEEDDGRPTYSQEFVMEMLKLQRDLMSLRDKHAVQRIVDIIVETRKFTITSSTFDFDLCKLDVPTLDRVRNIMSIHHLHNSNSSAACTNTNNNDKNNHNIAATSQQANRT